MRFSYINNWLFLEIEPYALSRKNKHAETKVIKSYKYLNNQSNSESFFTKKNGLKQSQIIIHYKGFGMGYGFINNWLGPGFHNSVTCPQILQAKKLSR